MRKDFFAALVNHIQNSVFPENARNQIFIGFTQKTLGIFLRGAPREDYLGAGIKPFYSARRLARFFFRFRRNRARIHYVKVGFFEFIRNFVSARVKPRYKRFALAVVDFATERKNNRFHNETVPLNTSAVHSPREFSSARINPASRYAFITLSFLSFNMPLRITVPPPVRFPPINGAK